ncbi:16S rRNA (guanine(527)-N(7))-methyltransferase RsmG [Marinobacter sp. JSM 1782161]|uniref:16S rRNA (guanine(527)-N(7))-methyltransferase RsmG n=1 Tax=Marinobacter sp. JSM 1782161 TaxID=2685906 RepID=UPI001403291D|nr:16S rRNA (guanine(527)-N(7))-methyltransferase RsmG [Marinobacter sp. JSM 1782161]
MSGAVDNAWPRQLRAGLDELGLELDEAVQQRLLDFLGLLQKWNRAYNLTAVREPHEMVSRQLLDSLAILPYIKSEHLLDVGAGGGLPGIPLAIVCPGRQFTLLDSNSKKTRFLTQCVLELGLDNVTVIHARAEDFQPGQGFEQITSRAFTALENLVAWCGHLLAPDGHFLAMKGQYPTEELEAMPADWRLDRNVELAIPGCEGARHLLIIDRVRTTGG